MQPYRLTMRFTMLSTITDRIEFIKNIRVVFGFGLSEAKQIADALSTFDDDGWFAAIYADTAVDITFAPSQLALIVKSLLNNGSARNNSFFFDVSISEASHVDVRKLDFNQQ
jgi:hypothetical protein